MNGEIQQAANIVISARKALFENKRMDFSPSKYILSIRFVFARKLFFYKSVQVDSVGEWFDICLKRGLRDIKFVIPTNRENKHLLGFSNTSQSHILCYWKGGKISCFCPLWEFDNEHHGWRIVYTERFIKSQPVFKNLSFKGDTEEFKQTLLDIQKFATDIDQPYFSDVFHTAYEALCNCQKIEYENIPEQLPDEFKNIYYAVDKADVFGAMGSWNDSPPCIAQNKGLYKEYNQLSDRLLIQLRYYLMYVSNECWNRN